MGCFAWRRGKKTTQSSRRGSAGRGGGQDKSSKQSHQNSKSKDTGSPSTSDPEEGKNISPSNGNTTVPSTPKAKPGQKANVRAPPCPKDAKNWTAQRFPFDSSFLDAWVAKAYLDGKLGEDCYKLDVRPLLPH